MWGGGGWWVVGTLVMVVCIFLMVRMMGHGGTGHDGRGDVEDQGNRGAHDILAERFARGEISEEEFQRRTRALERLQA